ncbi:Zinc finger BED domain-containing protein RICESLEEPER 3 [Linum perenne]
MSAGMSSNIPISPVVDSTNVTPTTTNQATDIDQTDVERPYAKKPRVKTSGVWKDFKELPPKEGQHRKVQCIHCKKEYKHESSGPTSHLGRHLTKCPRKIVNLARENQQQLSVVVNHNRQLESVNAVETFKYNQTKMREVICHWIILEEQPLCTADSDMFTYMMKHANPLYQRISRASVTTDLFSIYEIFKRKLQATLANVRRKKVWKIIVDNATSNDVAMITLKGTLNYLDRLSLDGELFHMLAAALELKGVFPRYAERDSTYTWLPSDEDWVKVSNVCQFLEVFGYVTTSISGSSYPTSNIFLPELWSIKRLLKQTLESSITSMRTMAAKMLEKFDKYWGQCNLVVSFAAVLDPTNKFTIIDVMYPDLYNSSESSYYIGLVREKLTKLYNEYVTEFRAKNNENPTKHVHETTSATSIANVQFKLTDSVLRATAIFVRIPW